MIQKENSFGTFDQEINTFFKDAHHFASLINTCLYQGQEIVKPENLMLVDPKIQTYTRDVLMLWNGRYGSYYLGIENQLVENYPMPYRILQYDCLVYKDQMDALEKEHRKKKDLRSSEEFLSGIKASDRLIPCITIVIYYGTRPWQTNFCMKDMFDVKDVEHLNEYKMNLIEVHSDTHRYKDKELDLVFSITRDILNGNFKTIKEKYKQSIPKQVALVIASMAKDEELYQQIKEEEKEVIVMCESLDRMREEARAEGMILGRRDGLIQGKTEGIQIGRIQGESEGLQKGRIQGKEEGVLTVLKSLLKKGISDSYILEITGVSSELLMKAKQGLN